MSKDTEKKATEKKAPVAAKEVKKAPFTVADGKAITTAAGVKGSGAAVEAKDLRGGDASLKKLVAAGIVKANK